MQEIIEQFADSIRSAAAQHRPLRLRGSGSKDFYGSALSGTVLDARPCRGIVSYEPQELVLTARAGTTLAEIEKLLSENGQMLPFEPPHFGPAATLGGCIATGLSGPRRAYQGAARDFVLGVRMLDGRGDLLTFGGQVMKNVAGYDVSRLQVGAMGTLGLLLEISLKVLPRPVAEITLRFDMDQAQAPFRAQQVQVVDPHDAGPEGVDDLSVEDMPSREERPLGRRPVPGGGAGVGDDDLPRIDRDDPGPGDVGKLPPPPAHHEADDGGIDLLGVRDQIDRAPELAAVGGACYALREQLGEIHEHARPLPPGPILGQGRDERKAIPAGLASCSPMAQQCGAERRVGSGALVDPCERSEWG